MGFIINNLGFEVTRKCNLVCGHCMRGAKEEVCLTEEFVDSFFNDKSIERVNHLLFSGGEPTLNPDIIIYTIDKIIAEEIDVLEIVMVTNGQIFNRKIVDKFNEFNEYRNNIMRNEILLFGYPREVMDSIIATNTDNHARITFSTDRYHRPISQAVIANYVKYAKGLQITKFSVSDDNLYKTGFSEYGTEIQHVLGPLGYMDCGDNILLDTFFYLTATGYLTNTSIGQFSDMDRVNFGHITDINFLDIFEEYNISNFGKKVQNNQEKVFFKKQ